MKIIDCKKAENCLEGEFIFIYCFDEGWTEEYIRLMESFGVLRYYESFPRPMFQVKCSDGTVIKGLLAEKECRVIFPRSSPEPAKDNFEAQMSRMLEYT